MVYVRRVLLRWTGNAGWIRALLRHASANTRGLMSGHDVGNTFLYGSYGAPMQPTKETALSISGP